MDAITFPTTFATKFSVAMFAATATPPLLESYICIFLKSQAYKNDSRSYIYKLHQGIMWV